MENSNGPSAAEVSDKAESAPAPSPPTDSAAIAPSVPSSSSVQSAEERLHALESKTAAWKEAVAAQLNDAARKNKKLREEVRVVREEKEAALSALRVQLTEEFDERTVMQREELAALTQQAALLREEKKAMAAAHEAELHKTRLQLREVIQVEVETAYKRREEQWEKEKATLLTRADAKETERVQAEHECEVLKLRLGRLGAQYEELASLLQPTKDSATSPTHSDASGSPTTVAPTKGSSTQDASRQQTAANAAFTQQIESIKAELQSKEQHTQFVLDRARQEHEAEKAQLLRELQLREEELKVAHTLLKQVQSESSGYLQRVSHAQTERQSMEQRFAAKVSALSAELAERMRAVDEAQAANRRLTEQLRAAQEQVATLEEESTMREEAFHSLMLSEDNKRVVMDLQKAVQAARDEAEGWKMRYYTALSQPSSGDTPAAGHPPDKDLKENGGATAVVAADASSSQAWQEQLAAKESALAAQATQLERKAHLLEAAEAKLNDMRRSMASQASLLLQQQKSARRDTSGDAADSAVAMHGVDSDDEGRDMLDASPLISTAASLLPSSMHGSLRTLESYRRRLHLPGNCRCLSCYFSGGGTSGAPLRIRRNPFVLTLVIIVVLFMVMSVSKVTG